MNEEDKNKIKEYSKQTELYKSRRTFNSKGVLIEKKCSVCKKFKKLSEFHKDKKELDGLYNKCKTCNSKKN
jgi:hypothetical protein